MSTRFVLAIDAGSTGVRALLFDREGRVVAQAYREISARYSEGGRVEQDAREIWDRTLEVARAALGGVAAADVAALGVTGQRSTAVAWDAASGEPLHAVLSWQDLRGAERAAEVAAEGHWLTAQQAAIKLDWLLRNVAAVRRGVDGGTGLLGTVESWLLWKLSRGALRVTDPSFASPTGLYDYFAGTWNAAILDRLEIPEAALPEIRSSSEVHGAVDPELLGAPIPIAGLAGDQQAAAFGQLAFEPGTLKASHGTSLMVDVNTGDAPVVSGHGAYPLVLWRIDGETVFCLEGQATTAGGAVQWLRDGLGIVDSVEESARVAAGAPDRSGVWAVPAFQGLGTPYFDPAARAAIGGLSRGTTRAEVVRAVLEGLAFRCREVVEALAADCGRGAPEVLRVDGGAAANDWLMQFESDVLGIPVERPETLDAAATGAAFLAGLAVGFWDDREALRRAWRLGRRFEPAMSGAEREERFGRFKRAVAAVRAAAS